MPAKAYLYRFYDHRDALLYVGISLNVAARVSQHSIRSRWAELARTIRIQPFPSREAAARAEKRAILREQPKFNILLRSPARRKAEERISDAKYWRDWASAHGLDLSTVQRAISSKELRTIHISGRRHVTIGGGKEYLALVAARLADAEDASAYPGEFARTHVPPASIPRWNAFSRDAVEGLEREDDGGATLVALDSSTPLGADAEGQSAAV